MADRHFKREEPNPKIVIRVPIAGKEVLFETNQTMGGGIGTEAKMQIQPNASRLVGILLERGEDPESIHRMLRKLITDSKADLVLIDSLIEVACHHARALRNPLVCIEEAYDITLAASAPTYDHKAMAVSRYLHYAQKINPAVQ